MGAGIERLLAGVKRLLALWGGLFKREEAKSEAGRDEA